MYHQFLFCTAAQTNTHIFSNFHSLLQYPMYSSNGPFRIVCNEGLIRGISLKRGKCHIHHWKTPQLRPFAGSLAVYIIIIAEFQLAFNLQLHVPILSFVQLD